MSNTTCRCGHELHDHQSDYVPLGENCSWCPCPEFRPAETREQHHPSRNRGVMDTVVRQELTRLLHGSALAQLLAQHAPYLSKRSDNKLCLRCLDDAAHGEFETVDDWAAHVAAALTEAGWKKRR